MTISLTEHEYYEQFQEADKKQLHLDMSDELDVTLKSNGRVAQGWMRRIHLREGIFIQIEKTQSRDRLLLTLPEEKRLLKWHFLLSGKQQSIHGFSHKKTSFSLGAGRYVIYGSGLTKSVEDCSEIKPILEVTVGMQPEMLHSFVGDTSGELPKIFNHLVRPFDRECYKRGGETSAMVSVVLQQILQCPYKVRIDGADARGRSRRSTRRLESGIITA